MQRILPHYVLCSLLLIFAARAVDAAAPSERAPGSSPTLGAVEQQIETLSNDTELDEAARNRLLALYRIAKSRLESAAADDELAATMIAAMRSATVEIDKLKKQREQLEAERQQGVSEVEGVARQKLEQTLTAAQANVSALDTRLSELGDELATLESRPGAARAELLEARSKLAELESQAETLPDDDDPVRAAQHTAALAGAHARNAEIERVNAELASHEARLDLATAKNALVTAERHNAAARVQALSDALRAQRLAEAAQAAAAASKVAREATGKHPSIAPIAEENAELSDQLGRLITAQDGASIEQAALSRQLQTIERDYAHAREGLEIAGLSSALGEVLRAQRRKLPDLRSFRDDVKARQDETSKVGLAQFQIEDKLEALGDLERATRAVLSEHMIPTSEARARVTSEVRALLKDQRELLADLASASVQYLATLRDLDFQQKQLFDQATEYAAFLDERLLWIPSADLLSWHIAPVLLHAVEWFLRPSHWIAAATAIFKESLSAPALTGVVAVVLLILFRLHVTLVRRLGYLAERVKSVYSDAFTLSIRATVVTAALAVSWPLLVFLAAWYLRLAPSSSEFVKALGAGLWAAALPFFLLRVARYVCRPLGLADAHFRWPQATTRLLRRHLWWLAVVIVPTTFVTAMAGAVADRSHYDAAGRISFMVASLALAVFIQRVFSPNNDIVSRLIAKRPNGWLSRLRYVWYPAAVGFPVVLAVLAAIGYFYAAVQLQQRLYYSLWLVAGIVLVRALVSRWLVVAQRRLAWKKAQAERDAQRALASGEGVREGSAEGASVALASAEVDIETINAQTRHLLNTLVTWSIIIGMWVIWAALLPALNVFDDFTLWQYSTNVDGQDTLVPITLSDLAFAAIVGAIVIAAARNLPGVMEIAVLQRLPLDSGSRYAITTVSQYLIVAIGVSTILGAIGLGWSRVQWLVAALGVGLGFGLQEIFANFVSGLILLFERPVRIGDTVTVDNLSGTVSRIRIRATTIVDWDNKEIIVPNKTFITGNLINWTLSDPITRVVIPIGIAYGSDTALAYRVIKETADRNPLVLREPEPQLFFVGLGESSLDFELRVYVRALVERLPVTHELLMAVEKALGEHSIEIPFPQRDLHIRSVQTMDDAGTESKSPGLRIVDPRQGPATEPEPRT